MSELTQVEQAIPPASVGKWKPYPAYKDSGIEWLGEIPEHWEARRLKYLARLSYGDSLPADTREDGIIPVFGSNGQVGFHSRANTNAPVIVIGRKGSYGKLNFSNQPSFAIDTTYFIDTRNTKADLYWLFYALSLVGLDTSSEDSAIPGLSRELAHAQFLPLPSPQEQRAIAAFLDRENDRINAHVAKKERLIELLREKRAALISHAVTKGLNPDARMKDLGVQWLGEIPEHWEVRRLKYVANIFGGGTPFKENLDFWKGNIPWVSPKDMKSEFISNAEDHITNEAIENSTTRLISAGAVLIVVRSGILIHSIPVAINTRPVAINQDLKAVILKPDLNSHYFVLMVRGFQNALLKEWRKEGTTVESIEYENLANTPCLIPPILEQKEIATILNHETAKLDALITRIRQGIEKLQEYRVALIAAAVTGKIDVRENTE